MIIPPLELPFRTRTWNNVIFYICIQNVPAVYSFLAGDTPGIEKLERVARSRRLKDGCKGDRACYGERKAGRATENKARSSN